MRMAQKVFHAEHQSTKLSGMSFCFALEVVAPVVALIIISASLCCSPGSMRQLKGTYAPLAILSFTVLDSRRPTGTDLLSICLPGHGCKGAGNGGNGSSAGNIAASKVGRGGATGIGGASTGSNGAATGSIGASTGRGCASCPLPGTNKLLRCITSSSTLMRWF